MFIFTVCDYLQKLLKELKWDLILSLGLKIGMMKIYIFFNSLFIFKVHVRKVIFEGWQYWIE